MEILVVVALVSVVGLTIASLFTQMFKMEAKLTSTADFNSIVNTVQSDLNNSDTCTSVFSGITVGNQFPQPLSLDVGLNPKLAAGAVYPPHIKITKFEFQGKRAINADQWWLDLYLEADRQPTIVKHQFTIAATLDANGAITFCAGYYVGKLWTPTGDGQNITYNVGGSVGIGLPDPDSTGPPPIMLDVSGFAQADKFIYRSDARLKENIREIDSPLERVLQLHGVTFDWKDPAKGKNQLGLIAQEVETVFPEVVTTSQKTGLKSVAYATLVGALVEAIKEQNKLIIDQQKELRRLKTSLAKKGIQ